MIRNVFLLVLGFILSASVLNAQSGELTMVKKSNSSFKSIEIEDALNVFIEQGSEYSVMVETYPEFQEKLNVSVKNDVLKFNLKSKTDPDILNIYITFVDVESIDVGGASNLNSKGEINLDHLELDISGASDVNLNLNVKELISDFHGASDVNISGNVVSHVAEIHGASDFDGSNFISEDTQIYVHGAATADINANTTKRLISKVDGAGSLFYSGEPEIVEIEKSSSGTVNKYEETHGDNGDTVKVNIGRIKVEVYEDDDSTKVIVGDIKIKAGDDGNVVIEKADNCKKKYNGHWAGLGLGVNGYLSPSYQMEFPKSDEYLDLKMGKSVAVHLNMFEQNISLLKNQHVGITTGLGLTWNNYRFNNNTRLAMQDENGNNQLLGYRMNDVDIKKTKLTAMYLTVPLILEFQTGGKGFKDFYVAGGVLGNLRLLSHTKIYYNELNKDITLSKYDPEIEDYYEGWTATTPDNNKVKVRDDFYLNPFKIDATARIGWGFVELFGTYSMTSLFKDNKAPELIPWTIGLTIVDF